MGSNESISSKQFLSKIEEGQAKLYYDIGKRVHSYFEETFKEAQQYLQQFPPQDEGVITEDFDSNEQSPRNYELLQQEIQKLKSTNENQKSQIQKLKEEKAQLLRKTTKPSSKKVKDKNENETDNMSSPDETEPKTKKTRTPKNMKTLEVITVEDVSNEDQSELWDYAALDLFMDQVDKDNDETSELNQP